MKSNLGSNPVQLLEREMADSFPRMSPHELPLFLCTGSSRSDTKRVGRSVKRSYVVLKVKREKTIRCQRRSDPTTCPMTSLKA